MQTIKTILKPRISVNKLGEYIKSSPYRRKVIVENQKYPKGFVVARYNDVKSTIIDFFVNGKGDKDNVKKKIEGLIQKSYASAFRNQDNKLSIEALDIFQKTNTIDLSKYSVHPFEQDQNKLLIQGVEVSIEPQVLVRGTIKGKEFIGAIKIHISKSHPLNADSGKYIATMIHSFLEKTYREEAIRPEFCISLDIFTGNYFTAPRAFKSLRRDIEAACNEIRLLWNDL